MKFKLIQGMIYNIIVSCELVKDKACESAKNIASTWLTELTWKVDSATTDSESYITSESSRQIDIDFGVNLWPYILTPDSSSDSHTLEKDLQVEMIF